MIFDKLLRVSSEQAITSTAASTDVIDLGVAADLNPGRDLELVCIITEAFTAAGAATLQVQLQGSTDNSSFTTMLETAAIGKADLTIGRDILRVALPGPIAGQSNPRYIRLNYVVATGPMTAGKVNAGFVLDRQRNHAYPPGVTVSN